MLRKICPCISWFSSGEETRRKSYNPDHELEEEEFMHHIESEGKRYEDSNRMIDEEIPIEEQLDQ